jgi:CxxC motif-containing protein
MEKHNLICIVCPVGCRLTLVKDDTAEKGYVIEGNNCARGIKYGIDELTNPTRMIPTTVRIKNGLLNRLPVRTQSPVPKELIFECMKVINDVEVNAPVKLGDVIVENILDTGVNIIATRSMDVKS